MYWVYEHNFVLFRRFGIFNPTIVYDHLGEIFSALIFGSFVFCIFLYIKVSVHVNIKVPSVCLCFIFDSLILSPYFSRVMLHHHQLILDRVEI